MDGLWMVWNRHDGRWDNGQSGTDKWADSALAGGEHAQVFNGDGGDTIQISNHDGFPTGASTRTTMVWMRNVRGDGALFQHGCWSGEGRGWNWGMSNGALWALFLAAVSLAGLSTVANEFGMKLPKQRH